MSDSPVVVLRYFNCRGRAQGLRNFFADSSIAFTDDRVGIDDGFVDWINNKKNTAYSGMFARLPVLVVDDCTVSETLSIAVFLNERFALYADTSEQRKADLNALVFSACQDISVRVAECFWLDVTHPGASFSDRAITILSGVTALLPAYNKLLPEKGAYFGGNAPALADYFLHEAVDLCRTVMEDPFTEIFDQYDGLARWLAAMDNRPILKRYIADGNRPTQFSGKPDELKLWPQFAAAVAEKFAS